MEKRPIMLIVDNIALTRSSLRQLFQADYVIIEASDVQSALQVIESQPVNIVLVDLSMPVMNGYELINILKSNNQYRGIPIVAMAAYSDGDSEVRAMEMGAADFITKPFNPTIVRCRIRNVMARAENELRKIEGMAKDQQLVEMCRMVENDSLTDIYNRETFYRKTAELMRSNVNIEYAIVYLDISCFKVINDLFRIETGNLILETAAYYFKVVTERKGLCARIEADHFVLCLPAKDLDIEALLAGVDSTIASLGISHSIKFYAGVYNVENVFLPVDQMCDRAHMALNKVKGNYINRYSYYDKSMRAQFLEEQMIVRDMEFALQEHQFCIYMQPVYNLHTNHIVSAEALVRWQHPVKGIISPAKFIPVFEHNGFIIKLDRFVWEEVCKFLNRQQQSGQAVPISVNVSRLNFYNRDLLDFLLMLVKKYNLPTNMLKLEVTETAYTENPHQLMGIVREFREHGFPVLMDDFGCGYSSLNMLKDLPVDVLKIDMAFVQELEKSSRANAIMKSIVGMAKNLDMGIIVEGVETKTQIDFLAGIGCENIQGYYFSKPLPVAEFVGLLERDINSRRKTGE